MIAGYRQQASVHGGQWQDVKPRLHGHVPSIAPQPHHAVNHLLALVFFHLLLQESSCAFAQLGLLPLHSEAALLLPFCRRCHNRIGASVRHIRSNHG